MDNLDSLKPRGRARRGPKSLLGDEPRDRIYEAALRCFDRDGVGQASMDGVAREAGVSRPTVYYYFPTKEDLVREVVARQAAGILRDIHSKLGRRRGLDRLLEAVFMGIKASLDNQYARLLIGGDAAGLTGRMMDSDQLQEIERGFWVPLLEQARSAGQLRADREFEDVIRLIVFSQFVLVTHQDTFALSDQRLRDWVFAYLAGALTQQQPRRRS